MDVEIENAQAVRVIGSGGEDLTDRVTLTGTIPDLELTAEPEIARLIRHVEMQSSRTDLWPGAIVHIGDRERLAMGRSLFIDARIRYTD